MTGEKLSKLIAFFKICTGHLTLHLTLCKLCFVSNFISISKEFEYSDFLMFINIEYIRFNRSFFF